MSFLSELTHWFMHGRRGPSAVDAEIVETDSAGDQPAPRPESKNALPDSSEPSFILDDLRKLERVSRQFHDARERLINELKGLAPPVRKKTKIAPFHANATEK